MGKEFYREYPEAREPFDRAGEVLGFDLKGLCFEGPEDELGRTENTQPAILVASVAALRVLEAETGARPGLVAGHSLGEYTALVLAGSLELQDAVRLVHMRGKFMQEGAAEGTGGMCAVIGLGLEEVEAVCGEASIEGNVVVPANINGLQQIVVSGHKEAVDRAAVLAKDKGAKKVVLLPVSVPSHSPLMEGAAGRLSEELEKTEFRELKTTLLTNVEAKPLTDVSKVRGLLTRQLTSPVRWVDIVRRMASGGVTTAVEIGPGRVLTGLVRRIDKGINTVNLDKPGDMEKVLSVCG